MAFGFIVAVRLVITLLFVPAILVKLRNLYLRPGAIRRGSGVEIIALAALWIPALATSASAALMITTAGATGTWVGRTLRSGFSSRTCDD